MAILARTVLAAILCLAALAAQAANLSIQPLTIVLDPARATGTVRLSNQGDTAASFEAGLFTWSQLGGTDELTPTDAWVVTPPIFTIQPGETQTLRIGRLQLGPVTALEQAFRLRVEELPPDAPAGGGTVFLVSLLLPVFLPGTDATGPQLIATLQGGRTLAVRNEGAAYAKLLAVTQDSEPRSDFTSVQSLSSYVLAGQSMTVELTAEAAAALKAGARLLFSTGAYAEIRLVAVQ